MKCFKSSRLRRIHKEQLKSMTRTNKEVSGVGFIISSLIHSCGHAEASFLWEQVDKGCEKKVWTKLGARFGKSWETGLGKLGKRWETIGKRLENVGKKVGKGLGKGWAIVGKGAAVGALQGWHSVCFPSVFCAGGGAALCRDFPGLFRII